jgi:hypothetical protein
MAIKLKNYTTEVAASKSIDLIEKLLVDFGASNIMKEYEELPGYVGKICSSISFLIAIEQVKMPFKLPANAHKVAKWMKKQKPNSSAKVIAEQSYRIAWKQQYEILFLQLSQLEMDQLEKLEVLFPYLYDVQNQQTYYEKLKAGGFKQLTAGNES